MGQIFLSHLYVYTCFVQVHDRSTDREVSVLQAEHLFGGKYYFITIRLEYQGVTVDIP
jgi:hypothetical protein